MMEVDNPFLALFESKEEVSVREKYALKQREEISVLLTRIFLFTASDFTSSEETPVKSLPQFLVHLPQLARDEVMKSHSGILTLENYSVGLAERILLPTSDFQLLTLESGLSKGLFLKKHNAMEPSAIKYLAECYSRAVSQDKFEATKRCREGDDESDFYELKSRIVKQCKDEIISRASVIVRTDRARQALLQSTQKISPFTLLVKESIISGSLIPVQFFYDIADNQSDNLQSLKIMFDDILDNLYSSFPVAKLSTPGLTEDMNMLEFFSSHPALCKVLVNFKHWLPANLKNGRAFEVQTILGKFLSPSCVPESPLLPSSSFPADQNLNRREVEHTTASLHFQLDEITKRIYKIFDGLFRQSPESRKALLTWLVHCFDSNGDRGKMSSRIFRGMHITQATDGFFLNLCWVMLRLCAPFLSNESAGSKRMSRISTIDVTYCAVKNKEMAMSVDSGGALVDFSGDSKIVPQDVMKDGQAVSPNVPFNFITHCFFLTHRCLILGMTQVIYKYRDLNRNLAHLHGLVGNLEGYEPPPGSELHQALTQFRIFSSQLLAIKAHALNPALLGMCLSFYSTTAQWMVQLAVGDDGSSIPDELPVSVQTVPECLVENMSNIVMVLRQMDSQLAFSSRHQVNQFISFTTVFMRSSRFIHNPHIRAKLAQLIQFMVHSDEASTSALSADYQKEIFSTHTLASKHLIAAVLSIFVDIEYTGESMEFEDKFMYRLPMYEILEFLWKIPSYRPSIEVLAEEVIHSDMDSNPPAFLRFINMLINDATIQLDEGLENLATIKEIEDLKDSEEWSTFSNDRKKECEGKLKEARMYATNRNQLGSKTVIALKFITEDTRKPFVIPGIVDRIAVMLNYVLKQLVGEESRNLKVRDAEKYHFSPRDLVRNIIAIYINLGQEMSFCEALPRDGRSFSMELFPQAERVLWIVSEDQISEWKKLSLQVKECFEKLLLEEGAFEDAPEEFLDPFTNELMNDPVTLPTSGHTTDRFSILRHLLSDQHDPFNRALLTADMLQPNQELQKKIQDWKRERLTKK